MRIVIFFLFFISCLQITGQEVVLSFTNEAVSKRIKKESYTISNSLTNDLVIVVIERKKIFAYLYDNNFKLKGTIETENVKSKYNKALGFSVEGDMYSVLYTNDNRNKFAILSLDFSSSKGVSNEIDIELADDLLLDAISYNNELFLLTARDQSSLSIRKFDQSNFEVVKTATLDEISNKSGLISSKVQVGLFVLSGYEKVNITKIDSRVSNSIEQTSKENKMYQDKQYVYLTFDGNKEATLFYSINLENYDISLKQFSYPTGKVKEFKKFNSFFFKDKLFQIASSKEEMAFVVKTLENEVIKEHYIRKDLPITFKNSPIIQEGQTALPFVTKREMEQTNRYLRKISSSDIGLTVVQNNDKYYITLGGYKIMHNSGGTMVMPVNTNNGVFSGYNTTYFAYQGYSTTRSTYFNSIFNLDFNHVEGTFEKNTFDRIKDYQLSKKYISGEDVFILKDDFYLGYFNQKESKYNLVKF